MWKRIKKIPLFFYQFKQLMKGRCPGQLVIQMTDRCNAQCPQCGMRAAERFTRSDINLYDMKCILDRAAGLGIKAVSLTGGEPMLRMQDVLRLAHCAQKAGIDMIRSGTNGFMFQLKKGESRQAFDARISAVARDIAQSPIRNFWISIDSCIAQEHERMRGFPGVIDGIRRAVPLFHKNGFYPSVNLGINRNILGEKTRNLKREDFFSQEDYLRTFEEVFYEAFCRFYAFVIDMGFTIVNACYPMSSLEIDEQACDAVYPAASADRIVSFDQEEKKRLFCALLSALDAYRSRIRIFTPAVSLYALMKQYGQGTEDIHACRGGIDYFYINAKDGHVYPCGYRGLEDMGAFIQMKKLPEPAAFRECFLCDWECFRDPSELIGPVIDALKSPAALRRRWKHDPKYFRLWMEDLRYYQACRWFNGRKGINQKALSRFKPSSARPVIRVDYDR